MPSWVFGDSFALLWHCQTDFELQQGQRSPCLYHLSQVSGERQLVQLLPFDEHRVSMTVRDVEVWGGGGDAGLPCCLETVPGLNLSLSSCQKWRSSSSSDWQLVVKLRLLVSEYLVLTICCLYLCLALRSDKNGGKVAFRRSKKVNILFSLKLVHFEQVKN